MRSALPLSLRRPVFGALGKLYPKADWAPRVFRAKTTFEGIARSSVEGLLPLCFNPARPDAQPAIQPGIQIRPRWLRRH